MNNKELIMTREEMLKRLDAGEDPLDISIEKWERLIKWMKLNPNEYLDTMWFHSVTCALCEVYQTRKYGCSECIISAIDCCLHENSTWEQFDDDQTIENAQEMFDVLKSAKE